MVCVQGINDIRPFLPEGCNDRGKVMKEMRRHGRQCIYRDNE